MRTAQWSPVAILLIRVGLAQESDDPPQHEHDAEAEYYSRQLQESVQGSVLLFL